MPLKVGKHHMECFQVVAGQLSASTQLIFRRLCGYAYAVLVLPRKANCCFLTYTIELRIEGR